MNRLKLFACHKDYFLNMLMFIAVVTVLTILPQRQASAIFLDSGFIETDGLNSTIDLWFFELTADTNAFMQVNDLGGPPVAGADPDMIILKDDGTFSNIIASDTAAGTDPVVSGLFEAGHYIAVIANHLLMENDFNPFHTDVNLALSGYEYEFNGPDPEVGQINFNCKLSGNLDGTFSKKVYTGGSDTCSLPVVSVDEPGYLFLSGLIILSLMFQHKWRKN